MNPKKEAGELLKEMFKVARDLKGIHGGLVGIKNAAEKIVPKVESIGKRLKLTGPEKKKIAVEAVVLLLEKYGKGYISWIPDFILRWLVGSAVDKAVGLMNGKKG